MGEAAEALDQLAVFAGVMGVGFIESGHRLDAAVLVLEGFRMHPGHVGESANFFGDVAVAARGAQSAGRTAGQFIRGEGPRRVAKGVAGVLIHKDYLGERTVGRCAPVTKFAARGFGIV